jgi:hypothetical protein
MFIQTILLLKWLHYKRLVFIVSGNRERQCGETVQRFGDALCLHHQGMIVALK